MDDTLEDTKSYSNDYQNKSWENYSLMELGNWVHLFVKRSKHRSNNKVGNKKALKDIYDAENYLKMMKSKIEEVFEERKESMDVHEFEELYGEVANN